MSRPVCQIRFAIAAMLSLSVAAPALADPHAAAVRAAQYDLEAAKLAYRLARNVDYPRQSRQLRAEIELTREQVDHLQRRDRDYRQFNKFYTGNPLPISAEWNRLAMHETQRHLKELRRERSARLRYRGNEIRLLGLQVYAAHARLQELSGE